MNIQNPCKGRHFQTHSVLLCMRCYLRDLLSRRTFFHHSSHASILFG